MAQVYLALAGLLDGAAADAQAALAQADAQLAALSPEASKARVSGLDRLPGCCALTWCRPAPFGCLVYSMLHAQPRACTTVQYRGLGEGAATEPR